MTLSEHETSNHLLQQVSKDLGLLLEQVYQLETSVDDVTGEQLGNFIEMLLEQKLALDVNYLPITMKHSRPGILVRVLVQPDNLKTVIHLLMTELGTLGVRIEPITRVITTRDYVTVTLTHNGQKIPIRIKRSWNTDGKLIYWKPENKDVVTAARTLNVSIKFILHDLQQKIRPDTWTRENEDDG